MVGKDALDELLGKVEVFSSLDRYSLEHVKELLKPVRLARGETLCSEGDYGDRMYVLGSGELRVLKRGRQGNQVEIARLRPGEVAGMMSLFGQEPRSATLVAADAAEVWEIGREAFNGLLESEPTIARSLVAVLSRYLRQETRIVAELRSHDEDNRLKVAVFDSKPYTEQSFRERNADRYALTFLDVRLGPETAPLAEGFRVVCPFVNDRVDALTAERLAALGVELVTLRCAGYNNVDVAACEGHGISVTRVPAYSPYAVAEHAVALMMALNRHIHRAHNRIREGNFSLNGLVGFDMHGKTIGVIGTGKIGRCAIDILLGFGCRILAYDRVVDPRLAERAGVRFVSLEELLRESDIVTLHAPLTAETHHLINEGTVSQMKRGVMLINTSRGALVDTQSLIKGLVSGQIGSAGLDVYEEEGDYFYEDRSDSVVADEALGRLLSLNNVMVTSHMAFLTREALDNIAETTLENVREYERGLRGRGLTNAVPPAP